ATMRTLFRVVLADDNPDFRALLRAIIDRDPRFEVVGEAPDGAEAITRSLELQPDIVVLDLSMPSMDGFQAIGAIRTVSPTSRVLICTAFNNLGPDAVFLGADDYISKQIDARDFCDRLWSLLSETPKASEAQEEWVSPYLLTGALNRAAS
ncbi:MAG: response regulator transcription factor, partial [Actinomycetota bacterium]|nr:response regulator transcription factor [Actinomycetota bacterium]